MRARTPGRRRPSMSRRAASRAPPGSSPRGSVPPADRRLAGVQPPRFEIAALPAAGRRAPAPRARRQRRAGAGARAPRPGRAERARARSWRPTRSTHHARSRASARPSRRSSRTSRAGTADHDPRRLRRRRHLLDGDPRARAARARRRRRLLPARPRRDGYGLSERHGAAARGARHALLVTRDCAITAVEEVALGARARACAVVVTDHHSPRADGALPRAPIVHPALCGYPCAELCATAVAYKLAQAAVRARPGATRASSSRISTSWRWRRSPTWCRCVGENRTLVRRGLRALASTRKPGLRALMAVARVDPGRVDERAVGFALGAAPERRRAPVPRRRRPRADPHRGSRARGADRARAGPRQRRAPPGRDGASASRPKRRSHELGERPAYVLAGEGWHAGVIGIVASRLVERHRPPGRDDRAGRRHRAAGSGRSIDAFDLLGGLSAAASTCCATAATARRPAWRSSARAWRRFAAALAATPSACSTPSARSRVERVDAVVERRGAGDGAGRGAAGARAVRPRQPARVADVAEASFPDPRAMGEGKHVRFTVSPRAHAHGPWPSATAGACRSPRASPAKATFTLEVNEWAASASPAWSSARPVPVPDRSRSNGSTRAPMERAGISPLRDA